jgi:hypothetical protein
MARIVEQPSTQEESAARRFWREKMQAHPNVAGTLAIAGEVAGYFLNGHFIVALARWVIRVSGYVAESALLFAVLWISATSVAPGFIEFFMSKDLMQALVWLALIVLALVPEVILANAIVNALRHWQKVTLNRRNLVAWAWALLFTIPTVLFLFLTAYTLNNLVQSGGTFVQASTGIVGLRCFAGWTYGLLELVYAGVGRKMVNQAPLVLAPAQPAPSAAPAPHPLDAEEIARQLLPLVSREVKLTLSDTTQLDEQLHQLRTEMQEKMQQLETKISAELHDLTALFEAALVASQADAESNVVDIAVYRRMSTDDATGEQQIRQQRAQQSVNNTATTSAAKITRPLHLSETVGATDLSTKGATKRASSGQGAKQKAQRLLKRNPELSALELAKKAGISRQYASKIIAEFA